MSGATLMGGQRTDAVDAGEFGRLVALRIVESPEGGFGHFPRFVAGHANFHCAATTSSDETNVVTPDFGNGVVEEGANRSEAVHVNPFWLKGNLPESDNVGKRHSSLTARQPSSSCPQFTPLSAIPTSKPPLRGSPDLSSGLVPTGRVGALGGAA